MARISTKLKNRLIETFPNIQFQEYMVKSFSDYNMNKRRLERKLKFCKNEMSLYVKSITMKNPSPAMLLRAYNFSIELRKIAREYRDAQRALNRFWLDLRTLNARRSRKRKKK